MARKKLDLSVELFDCKLRNPLVLASGILGTTRDLIERVSREGAGFGPVRDDARWLDRHRTGECGLAGRLHREGGARPARQAQKGRASVFEAVMPE